MAEGFARVFGRGRVEAFSAGSRPAGLVDPRAASFMKERGIDLSAQSSKGLDDLPEGVTWDAVVTMGCGDACPNIPARIRLDWDVEDPKTMRDDAFRGVRDRIETSVLELIGRFASGGVNPDEGVRA
jgi:protein-tyrosine-phosphatase